MNKEADVQRKYMAGYEAFEGGDFSRANELADACMVISSQTSYWYAGALGLKCWVANFTHNLADLEQTTTALLVMDTGEDKPWFDGVALLNLGLAKRKAGNTNEAGSLFLRAAERYEAQQLHPGQPSEWQNVLDYFYALCRWAATEEATVWEEVLDQISDDDSGEPNKLSQQLRSSAQLMLRYSEGGEVKQEAVELVRGGVSRTFLAVILLG